MIFNKKTGGFGAGCLNLGLFRDGERNLTTVFVDVKNLEGFTLIQGKHLLRINIGAFAELRYMNESLDGWADLDECTKRSDTSNRTLDLVALLEILDFV